MFRGPHGEPRQRPRFPWFGPEQGWLALSLAVVVIGTMLPWFDTFLGSRPGIDGYGIFATWGAAVGLAGVFSLRERLFRVLAPAGAMVALLAVGYMTVEGARVCSAGPGGTAPCRPAVGLVISGAGAISALVWAAKYHLARR